MAPPVPSYGTNKKRAESKEKQELDNLRLDKRFGARKLLKQNERTDDSVSNSRRTSLTNSMKDLNIIETKSDVRSRKLKNTNESSLQIIEEFPQKNSKKKVHQIQKEKEKVEKSEKAEKNERAFLNLKSIQSSQTGDSERPKSQSLKKPQAKRPQTFLYSTLLPTPKTPKNNTQAVSQNSQSKDMNKELLKELDSDTLSLHSLNEEESISKYTSTTQIQLQPLPQQAPTQSNQLTTNTNPISSKEHKLLIKQLEEKKKSYVSPYSYRNLNKLTNRKEQKDKESVKEVGKETKEKETSEKDKEKMNICESKETETIPVSEFSQNLNKGTTANEHSSLVNSSPNSRNCNLRKSYASKSSLKKETAATNPGIGISNSSGMNGGTHSKSNSVYISSNKSPFKQKEREKDREREKDKDSEIDKDKLSQFRTQPDTEKTHQTSEDSLKIISQTQPK